MPALVHPGIHRDQGLGGHLAGVKEIGEWGLKACQSPHPRALLPQAHDIIAAERTECHPGQSVHQALTAVSKVIRRLLIFLLSLARGVTVRNGS